MKQIHILIVVFLLASLSCIWVPGALPPMTPTRSRSLFASPLPPTAEPPSATSIPTEIYGTDLVSATVPPAAPSPQPAIAYLRSGDPVILDRITMIDALHGWGISDAYVLFTEDSAQTWREATPPESLTLGSTIQAQGTFLDSKHAWIVFSFDKQIPASVVVWHTSDSGRTWTASAPFEHQMFGEEVWAEFFALDEMHIWLIVRGVYLGAGAHYIAQVLRSTDGGLTWLPLIGNINLNHDYTGLAFTDPNNGLVTWQTTGMWAPGPPEYVLTSDGAANWDVHQLPPPPDEPDLFDKFYYCEPFQPHVFSNRSMRMAVSCFGSIEGPQTVRNYLYSSEDGGSTWTSTWLPEKVQVAQEPEYAAQATLFFFDKDNALLLGRDIYRSTDGGQSWDHVKSVTWNGQFTFVDPQTGWAIARADDETALVKTSNGGASWMEIEPVTGP